MESSLSDLEKARKVYKTCVSRTLSHGTTTAAYFATIDPSATNLLANICFSAGQRAFIGRCCMDSDLQPEWYRDVSPEQALADTQATISHIKSIDPNYDIVSPIITPRFAPSCSSSLLKGLGDLAKETGLPVQTHVSENVGEIQLVKELFPEYENYTAVYEGHGLLSDKTILAHAIHLSEEEATLIKARESKVSHCPASNSAITSGAARVRWLLNKGIDVGLGTDMSGGYSPSVLEAVRQASLVSRHVAMVEGDEAKLSIEEVLFLATRGGAKVVGLNTVGGFEVGMEWDAQLIGMREVDGDEGQDEGPVDIFGWETWDERIAKWVFNGDDRNTLAVWVKGRLVHERRR
jgi:guanine deaminase